MRKNINANTSSTILVVSLLIAFFCDIKTINVFLTMGMGGDDESQGGPMAMLYLFSVLGVYVLGLISKEKTLQKTPKQAWFIFIWVSLFYLFTYMFIAPPYTSFLFFGVFTLASFLMPFVAQIDARLFLKSVMFFSVPAVFRLREIFALSNGHQDLISMGLSYSFLMPVIASFVYMFIYFKEEYMWQKVMTLILFATNLLFAYQIVLYGSRGPVFAMFATVAFMIIVRTDKMQKGVHVRKGRFVVTMMGCVFAFFAFLSLLSGLQEFVGNYGISFNFADKFIRMDQSGDISNGREVLYGLAMNDILSSPVFGMGLDQFNRHHGIVAAYPHNFLLQILYDGGILFLLVLVIPLWKALKRLWNTCNRDEFAVFAALLFSSVPRAMFSGDLWQNGPLWMLFGVTLCRTFVHKTKVLKDENEKDYRKHL